MALVPDALRESLARATTGVSAARDRQLRWVVGELALYAATLEPGQAPDFRTGHADEWFTPEFITGYLACADNGQLRRRGQEARPCSDATRRVRRACIRILALWSGVPDPIPDRVEMPAPASRADPGPARLALQQWSGRAELVRATPEQVRAAALAALVHEAGLRTGELAALTPTSVDLDAGTLTYQPRPPAARTLPPERTVPLSAHAVAQLRQWLLVREGLLAKTPRTKSLWVSVKANHDGEGRTRPPGLPLRPNGLRRAHARAVTEVNMTLHGTPGFAPLPRTVGRFRPSTSAASPVTAQIPAAAPVTPSARRRRGTRAAQR